VLRCKSIPSGRQLTNPYGGCAQPVASPPRPLKPSRVRKDSRNDDVARLLGIMALVMRYLGSLMLWTEIFPGRLIGLP